MENSTQILTTAKHQEKVLNWFAFFRRMLKCCQRKKDS